MIWIGKRAESERKPSAGVFSPTCWVLNTRPDTLYGALMPNGNNTERGWKMIWQVFNGQAEN